LILLLLEDQTVFKLFQGTLFKQFNYSMLTVMLAMYIITVVLVDYISLFFVRYFLGLTPVHPVIASVGSSIVGILVVAIGLFILDVGILFILMFPALLDILDSYRNSIGTIAVMVIWLTAVAKEAVEDAWFQIVHAGSLFNSGISSTFIIHLWLPLFALARLVLWIFRAVEKAQWFLKQGDAHPLKAIGVVATIIVFASAMMVKEGWALLGVLERS
jgi:hypothetical protein